MTKSLNKKIVIIIVFVAIFILIVGVMVFNKTKNNNKWKESTKYDEIVINEKDSKEVKKEKIEKKIELINKELDEYQLKLNPELEKLNALYREYVNTMNGTQTETDTTKTN